MKLEPIITSLLMNDTYKATMGKVLHNQFSDANVIWNYKNRDADTRKFTPEMVDEIKEQIKYFCTLKFTNEELSWMDETMPWLGKTYITTLKQFQADYDWYDISYDKETQQIKVVIEGPQYLTEWCETPTMTIISTVWFKMALTDKEYSSAEAELYKRTEEKIDKLVNAEWAMGFVSDFGLRRCFSIKSMEKILKMIIDASSAFVGTKFVGTSCMYFAKKFGIKPMGTMAHSYLETVGQGYPEYNPAYTNKRAMNAWVKEYGVENGIYLTDVIGTDVFLKDFTKEYATLFSGVRHDSGDPFEWGEKIIKHYEKLGINSKTKTLLFSDSLNFDKAATLFAVFNDRINVAFGIGTYITCDTNVKHMNQVLKIVKVNGRDVAKLSDTPGKTMCLDSNYVEYLQRSIDWRLSH